MTSLKITLKIKVSEPFDCRALYDADGGCTLKEETFAVRNFCELKYFFEDFTTSEFAERSCSEYCQNHA